MLSIGFPNLKSDIPILTNVWASLPEAGARCNSIARRDLCGGPRGNSGPYRDLSVSANLIMFTVVLGVGMAYLFTQHDLKTYETVGALLLLGLAGGLSGVLLIGLWLPSLLRSVLQWLQETVSRIAQRFQRHPPLPHDWAEKTTCEFAEAASAVRAHPRRLANTLCAALAAHALDLATLYVLFLAFRHSIDFGPLVAGYAMGILFWIVSPTPEGIGVVEGVMTLVYTSLDVPGSVALVVSVAFRGITFWLPLLLGFLVIRKTESFRSGRG